VKILLDQFSEIPGTKIQLFVGRRCARECNKIETCMGEEGGFIVH